MADVDSAPSTSSFNIAAYKESALALLTFLVPPAAIAVGQGKADLESRHLALSLALYLSVICYFPAVVHAYWLLYVRDNGGVGEWSGARLRQAEGLWNEHGGVAKRKVDEIAPKVVERFERVRTYATDKAKYANGKKDEIVAHVRETIAAAIDLFEDGRDAYSAGTFIDWIKEKANAAVEKIKAFLEPYPRLQAIVRYIELRVRNILELLERIYDVIRAKIQPAVDSVDQNGRVTGESREDSSASIPPPHLEETMDETPEDEDASMEESSEGKSDDEKS